MKKLTADDVLSALINWHPREQYACALEVAHATGFRVDRHLDLVVMDFWPSRGLEIKGIEIKVSLYDWKKELRDPSKAEQIARFCDSFYVAAPKGLIPLEEVPMAWGLMEITDDRKVIVTKKAKHTDAQPVDKNFLAAMVRGVQRRIENAHLEGTIANQRVKLENEFEERLKARVEQITRNQNQYSDNWVRLINALGDEPEKIWDCNQIIAAVKTARALKMHNKFEGITMTALNLRTAYRSVKKILDEYGIEEAK